MTNHIVQMVCQRTLCRTETQNVALTQTATPHRMSRVRCTRSAITATPATHSTRQRATHDTRANELENTQENTARADEPYSRSQHAKVDDTMYHVKEDFLGALGLCRDLRLRPDHPSVATVRLRDTPAHRIKKNLREKAADVLAVFVTSANWWTERFWCSLAMTFSSGESWSQDSERCRLLVAVRDKEPEDRVAEDNGSTRHVCSSDVRFRCFIWLFRLCRFQG